MFLHSGQAELLLVLNHLYRQAEWNFFVQVLHASFGSW